MIKSSQWWVRFLGSVLLLIGGIVGVCHPGAIPLLIVAFLGTVLMLSSALRLGLYMGGSVKPSLADVLISLLDIAGAFLILANGTATTTYLCVLLGLYVVAQGGIALFGSLRGSGSGQAKIWWPGLVCQALVMVMGLLIMLNPTATSIGIGVLVGSFLIVKGVSGLWGCIWTKKES